MEISDRNFLCKHSNTSEKFSFEIGNSLLYKQKNNAMQTYTLLSVTCLVILGCLGSFTAGKPYPMLSKKPSTHGVYQTTWKYPSSSSSTANVLPGDETPTSSTPQDHDMSTSVLSRMKFDLDEKSIQE